MPDPRLTRALDALAARHQLPEPVRDAISGWLDIWINDGNEPGQVIIDPEAEDRYEQLVLLEDSNRGELWRARDRVLGRLVALRVLHDVGFVELLSEARAAAHLQHPAIAAIHDVGVLPDGRLFYAMEEVSGVPIEQRIREAHAQRTSTGALRRILASLAHVAQALAYAHGRGVLHRTLTPRAILLGHHGEVRIVRFGEAAEGADSYLAPEVASGAAHTARSDQYALGAVLHHAIVGAPPPSALPDALDPELTALIERATHRDPDARFLDCTTLATALLAWLDSARPLSAEPETTEANTEGSGALSLKTQPASARALLFRLTEKGGRPFYRFERALDPTPLAEIALPQGAWVVALSLPKRPLVRYPVHIDAREHWDGVDPNGIQQPIALPVRLEPSECYIPAGWWRSSADGRRIWTDAFVIRRSAVTCSEYLSYLDDLVACGLDEDAWKRAPRTEEGRALVAFDRATSRWHLADDAPDDWHPSSPIRAIDTASIGAYLTWFSFLMGRPWRLPSEWEWEKAMCGVGGGKCTANPYRLLGTPARAEWCRATGSRTPAVQVGETGLVLASDGPHSAEDARMASFRLVRALLPNDFGARNVPIR